MALTADFVTAVRRQGQLTAQLTDSEILAAGDVEVRGRFLPLLRKVGAEYGVRRIQLPISNGRVRIPDRAQVAGVRLVQWVSGNGRYNLPQISPEQDVGVDSGPTPVGWYFDAGTICVVPSTSAGSLLIRYYQAASSMVLSSLTASTSEITAYVETSSLCTITYSAGTTLAFGDVISALPSHHVVVPGLVNGTGTANWLPAVYSLVDNERPVELGDIYRTINAGDRVAPNGQTPYVPLPEELFSALVHRTAGVMLSALGYLEEARAALELSSQMESDALLMLTPRSDGNPMALTGGISAALGQGFWGPLRRW